MVSSKEKHPKKRRLNLFLFFFAVLLNTSACMVTHTILDGLIYPATESYERSDNDLQALAVCSQLEEKGYQFDEFSVDILSVEVTYPDEHKEQFPYSYAVSPVVLTAINRDYDNPDIFSDEEFERLKQQASNFCKDYYQEANKLDLSLPLSGILYWDYLNGVRGGFHLSPSCEITDGYGWGTGSYASSYESDLSADCPSGHVSY
jgi:hypothetical protein